MTIEMTIARESNSNVSYRRKSSPNCFGPGRGLPGWPAIARIRPQGAFGVRHHRIVRSSDTPRWWKWWAAAIAGILLFAGVWAAINQLPRQVYFSPPIDSVPPSPSPVLEVRRALPVVEVRRALPTVLRALPVNSALVPVPTTGWQSIQMPNGAKIAVHYEGELPSSAALPLHGHFIGEEYSTGNTSWIWTQPAGTNVASWVDP